MDKNLFEFNFKFTNDDINKIFIYISDCYKYYPSIKKIRNTKYGLLFTFICFIFLDFSYLLEKQFDESSLVAFIVTFLLLIVFFLLKNPIKSFKFYFKKNINTNLVHISITDSKLFLEVASLKEECDLNSLINILSYDDILILIFENKPIPIIVSQKNPKFDEIICFFRSKVK